MKGDEMIKITYLKGKNRGNSKAFTTNPFLQILFLSVLFIASARYDPHFSAYSVVSFIGLAAALALPAVVYYLARSVRTFFVASNDALTETVSRSEFLNSRNYPKDF